MCLHPTVDIHVNCLWHDSPLWVGKCLKNSKKILRESPNGFKSDTGLLVALIHQMASLVLAASWARWLVSSCPVCV